MLNNISSIKNFIYMFLAKGIDLFMPLIIIPILVARIGMENYGIIAMSLSLALFVSTIVQYGFNYTGTREISRSIKENKKNIGLISSKYLVSNHIIGLFCLILLTLLLCVLDIEYELKFVYFFSLLYGVFYGLNPIWFFQGFESFKIIAIINSFFKVLYMVSIYLFVTDKSPLYLISFINFLSIFFVYLINMAIIFLWYRVEFILLNFCEYVSVLKDDIYIFLNQLIPNLYNSFSIFYLGMVTNSMYAGIVSASVTMVEIVITIFRILTNVFYPVLVKERLLFIKFSNSVILISLFTTFIFYIFSPEIIKFLFEKNLEDIVLYTRILCLSIIFSVFYIIYGIIFNSLYNIEYRMTRYVIFISCLAALVSFVATPKFGAWVVILVIFFSRFLFGLISYILYLKPQSQLFK